MKERSKKPNKPVGALWRLAALTLSLGCAFAADPVQVTASRPAAANAVAEEGSGASASSVPIQGPTLGFVYRRATQTLQPILGMPGSSHFGDALPLGTQLEAASVSPSQDYALAVKTSSGEVQLVDLRGGAAAPRELSIAGAGVDRIVLSPTGAAAALYDRDAKHVQLLAGLPDDPSPQGGLSLGALPGILTALAVDDGGQLVVAAFSEGDAGSLYLLSQGTGEQRIGAVGRVAALQFLDRADDVLVADYGRNEILLIKNLLNEAQTSVLATAQEGVVRPVAVVSSADGLRGFAVLSQSNQIASLSLPGGPVNWISCGCQPTTLDRLKGDDVFRLTEASDGPLYLLDAARGGERVVFVPASTGGGSSTPTSSPPAPRRRGR